LKRKIHFREFSFHIMNEFSSFLKNCQQRFKIGSYAILVIGDD
jgi:hypothetical protein